MNHSQVKEHVGGPIAALRAEAARRGAAGILLMTSDPHCGEYLPAHWSTVRWATGFTGDNATLVVLVQPAKAALWVDGRFFGQADSQLAGTGIQPMHMGCAGVPTVEHWLAGFLSAGQTLLMEGSCVPARTARLLAEALQPCGATLQSTPIADKLWPACPHTQPGTAACGLDDAAQKPRPPLPNTPCFLVDASRCGATPAEKLARVRTALKEAGATALVVARLDCVGWLCNLRAHDLACTPLAVAFAFLTQERCVLFLAPERLLPHDAKKLEGNGITLQPYDSLLSFLAAETAPQTVLCDEEGLNAELWGVLHQNAAFTCLPGADPILLQKGVKNAAELASLQECHLRDGVAMVHFWMDLEQAMAQGRPLWEQDIDAMLKARRGEQPGYDEDSFDTIAAYGANAAMMHYHAEGKINTQLEPRGFLLVDTGGQYDCGTTDITRTFALGPLTERERLFYTWTLQSHIDLARAVWLDYCTGFALDTLAREPLWRHLVNYRCGTGHGVGFMGSVHEGPQSLRPRNNTVFQPGMTITDEPGVYEEGEVGVRIENELVCEARAENEYGRWLGFAPLTLVPIDTVPLVPGVLSQEQLDWLNEYHRTVYTALAPRLTEPERRWLAEKTKAV